MLILKKQKNKNKNNTNNNNDNNNQPLSEESLFEINCIGD